MENQFKWDLIKPEGVIRSVSGKVNPHPSSLAGKTVLLRWNGKHNGNLFLDRIAELLDRKIRDVRIIKAWEVLPESANSSENIEISRKFAARLAELKPDITIASQGD